MSASAFRSHFLLNLSIKLNTEARITKFWEVIHIRPRTHRILSMRHFKLPITTFLQLVTNRAAVDLRLARYLKYVYVSGKKRDIQVHAESVYVQQISLENLRLTCDS